MLCCIPWNRASIPVILEIKQTFIKYNSICRSHHWQFWKNTGTWCKTGITQYAVTPTVFKLDQNPMMVSKEMEEEKIVGVDMFIESAEQPEVIAQKCQRHGGVKFKLINISNRGTQVWPTGSVYTNLVNQYNVRFESMDGSPLNQQDIIGSLCEPQWGF